MDGHKTNESYLEFKTPLPTNEKGGPSNPPYDKGKSKVNYTYIYDNVVNVIIVKDKEPTKPMNAITWSKEKVTFPGITNNTISTLR